MEFDFKNCVVLKKAGTSDSRFGSLTVVHFKNVCHVKIDSSSTGQIYNYHCKNGLVVSLGRPVDRAEKTFENYLAFMNNESDQMASEVILEKKETSVKEKAKVEKKEK